MEISKQIVLDFLEFVSIRFLIFEKGDKRKNYVRFFKICKYASSIFDKWDKEKNCVSLCKYTFLIFEKRG